jgi:hypothetical protein
MVMRCESTHPTKGRQCGLPKGHKGRHRNGTSLPSWEDPQQAFLGGGGFVTEEDLPSEDQEMLYGEAHG